MNLIVQERKVIRQNLFQFDNLQSLTSSLNFFPYLHFLFSFFHPSFLSFPSIQNKIPLILSFFAFLSSFPEIWTIRVLYCRIRIEEGCEVSNCWFNEEIRKFGSILELECMLVHIMRVGLKG